MIELLTLFFLAECVIFAAILCYIAWWFFINLEYVLAAGLFIAAGIPAFYAIERILMWVAL